MSNPLWPHGPYPARLPCPRNSPGKNTGVGSHSFLQGIFPIQGLNPNLPHCRRNLYRLSYQRSPRILEWVAYPISSRTSDPRNQTGVSCIVGGFFTSWTTSETLVKESVNYLIMKLPNVSFYLIDFMCMKHCRNVLGYVFLGLLQKHKVPKISCCCCCF